VSLITASEIKENIVQQNLEDNLSTKEDDIIPKFKIRSRDDSESYNSESKKVHSKARKPDIHRILFTQNQRFPTGC